MRAWFAAQGIGVNRWPSQKGEILLSPMPYAFTGRARLSKDTLNAYILQAWTVYLGLSLHARCWKVSCPTLCVVRARGNSEPHHVG
jgi:hypothetical protein